MSRRNQNLDRMAHQAKQIQVLFRDFKKMLQKCRELAQHLRMELPNDALYSNIQRTTLMKLNLLDLAGLVNLKNSLAKTTSELFQQDRELTNKKTKKEMKEKIDRENLKRRDSAEKPKSKQPQLFPNKIPQTERTAESLDSMRSSRSSDTMRQSKSIEIPIYKAKVETAQGKMDRISKYIASLKKNIKMNAEAAGSRLHFKDYLLTQPTYVKARTLLERYLMREEEVEHIITQTVSNKLKQFFHKSDMVTKDDNYYYVKIKKPAKPSQITPPPASSHPKMLQKEISEIQTPVASPFTEQSPIQIQAANDFQDLRIQIERKGQAQVEMFVKLNEQVESGAQRLNDIRQKRKEAFKKDEDIWDEL